MTSVERPVIRPRDLIQPYFAVTGQNRKEPIPNMPGIFRMSADGIVRDIEGLLLAGICKIFLFGVAGKKDSLGAEAISRQGAIQKAVCAIRKHYGGNIVIITDVCLCAFTDHGHCGILKRKKIDREKTLERLGRIAVSHADAGTDFVAPSAMSEGQVKAVRTALDRAGYRRTKIWAYAMKYASSFYGPFRGALHSAPKFGDRTAYQMNPADTQGSLRSALRDQKDGADILMVKPVLPYLDMLFRLKQKSEVPVAAFQVSGEYGMFKCAARTGIFDEKKALIEAFLAIRRAGADLIVSYYAKQAARWLREIHDQDER